MSGPRRLTARAQPARHDPALDGVEQALEADRHRGSISSSASRTLFVRA
jgi:hypothetical protein